MEEKLNEEPKSSSGVYDPVGVKIKEEKIDEERKKQTCFKPLKPSDQNRVPTVESVSETLTKVCKLFDDRTQTCSSPKKTYSNYSLEGVPDAVEERLEKENIGDHNYQATFKSPKSSAAAKLTKSNVPTTELVADTKTPGWSQAKQVPFNPMKDDTSNILQVTDDITGTNKTEPNKTTTLPLQNYIAIMTVKSTSSAAAASGGAQLMGYISAPINAPLYIGSVQSSKSVNISPNVTLQSNKGIATRKPITPAKTESISNEPKVKLQSSKSISEPAADSEPKFLYDLYDLYDLPSPTVKLQSNKSISELADLETEILYDLRSPTNNYEEWYKSTRKPAVEEPKIPYDPSAAPVTFKVLPTPRYFSPMDIAAGLHKLKVMDIPMSHVNKDRKNTDIHLKTKKMASDKIKPKASDDWVRSAQKKIEGMSNNIMELTHRGISKKSNSSRPNILRHRDLPEKITIDGGKIDFSQSSLPLQSTTGQDSSEIPEHSLLSQDQGWFINGNKLIEGFPHLICYNDGPEDLIFKTDDARNLILGTPFLDYITKKTERTNNQRINQEPTKRQNQPSAGNV